MRKHRWVRPLVIALVAVLVLGVVGLGAIPFWMMRGMNDHHIDFNEMYDPAEYALSPTELTLTTSDGVRLAAWQVDADNPRAAVVFTSGIHNPSVTAFFGHAAMLQKHGFSSVLVEMRGHGASEGDRLYLGMKEYLDVQAAVSHVKQQNPQLPVVAFGLSMGAATAVNAFGQTPQIDALIALSAYSTWADVFADNMRLMGLPGLLCEMEKPFVWLYLGITYGWGDLRIQPLNEIRKSVGRPMLLMHSRGDSQVPFTGFEKLTKAAPDAETFVRDGDHHFIADDDFLHPEEDEEYAGAILGFLDAHF